MYVCMYVCMHGKRKEVCLTPLFFFLPITSYAEAQQKLLVYVSGV